MTAHSSPSGSERGGNADTEVRASLSDGTVTSEDLPPALTKSEVTPPKIMPVEMCGAVGKCMGTPSSYGSYMPEYMRYREKTAATIAPYALQQLEAARAKDVATHEKNLPAIENNKRVAALIVALNESVGMPKRWSERDRNSRSRYPKTIGHDAGYLTDIARECKTDDGFASATSTFERMHKEYLAYAETGKREAEQAVLSAQREEAAKVERRKADIVLATILLRYNLPPETDWPEVLEHLCGKDQRLNLAVAMRRVRGDWNEGCGLVESALHEFVIRDNEDKDIAADVLGCTRDFEDGRVFRDTTWNYDRLFASVADRQLVADAEEAMKHAGRD